MNGLRRLIGGSVSAAALVVAVAGCGDAQDAASGALGAGQDAAGQAADAAGRAGAAGAAAASQQIQQLLQVNPVSFTTQSAQLSAEDTQSLQQIAGVVKTTGASISVLTHAGYADAAKSQALSEQRADAIVAVLTGAGVDKAKITAKPTGNTTAQGDAALEVQITAP